jgi:hypothetical protein
MPTSTPTTLWQPLLAGMVRWASTVKETNQRSAVQVMVAARMRAVPRSRRRASLRGGFVGFEHPNPRKLDVLSVVQHLDRACGEPARIPTAPFPLHARKADQAALAAAGFCVGPVLERPCQSVQTGGVGFFAVLGPPRSDLLLGAVPLSPQFGKGPRHVDILTSATLVKSRLDQLQGPVVGDPGGTAVGRQSTTLGCSRVQRKPVGLHHRSHRAVIRLV